MLLSKHPTSVSQLGDALQPTASLVSRLASLVSTLALFVSTDLKVLATLQNTRQTAEVNKGYVLNAAFVWGLNLIRHMRLQVQTPLWSACEHADNFTHVLQATCLQLQAHHMKALNHLSNMQSSKLQHAKANDCNCKIHPPPSPKYTKHT